MSFKLLSGLLCVLFFSISLYPPISSHAEGGKSVDEWIGDGGIDDPVTNNPGVQVDNNAGEEQESDSETLALDLIKMVVALIFVLALIYGLLKLLNKRNKMFQKVRTLDNLGGITLGPNRSLQVVRIGSKIYALGVGESVELLTEITDEETVNELLRDDDGQVVGSSPLSALFNSKRKNNNPRQGTSSIQFQQLFNNELSNLKKGRKDMVDRYQQKQKEDNHE